MVVLETRKWLRHKLSVYRQFWNNLCGRQPLVYVWIRRTGSELAIFSNKLMPASSKSFFKLKFEIWPVILENMGTGEQPVAEARPGGAWQKEINSILLQNQTERRDSLPDSAVPASLRCAQWCAASLAAAGAHRDCGAQKPRIECHRRTFYFPHHSISKWLAWCFSFAMTLVSQCFFSHLMGLYPMGKGHGASLAVAPKVSVKRRNFVWNGAKYTHLQ